MDDVADSPTCVTLSGEGSIGGGGGGGGGAAPDSVLLLYVSPPAAAPSGAAPVPAPLQQAVAAAHQPVAPPAYPWPLPAACFEWCTATLTPRFELRAKLGQGAYGEVWLAWDHSAAPPQPVAIKREAIKHGVKTIREIGLLQKLRGKSNLLQLRRVLQPLTAAGLPDPHFSEVYIVTEALSTDLFKLLQDQQRALSDLDVRCIACAFAVCAP